MEAEIGDKVKLATVKEEIEGMLLESSEPEIYLVKLKSGYNIGIKKEDVVNIEVIEKSKEKSEKKQELKQEKNLPNVDLIITGGTISSRLDPETGAVKWLTKPEELFKFYPEIFEIVNIRKVKIPFMKASENMDYLDWKEIARETEKSLNDKECKGVIITHGTDFLHYTSSALSFFLRNLNKPVVLTYAQRSSDRASSDASLNLKCAAYAAISDIAEVMLVGHASMNDDFCFALRGSKVRKLHSSKRDAFKPVNTKPIAKIFPSGNQQIPHKFGISGPQKSKDFCGIEVLSSYNKRNDERKVELDDKFNDKIALIKFYPGMEPEIFDFLSRYEGVVLELSGLGHLAIDEVRKNLLPALKKAIDNGLVVCAAPQTIYGRLDPLVYSPGRKLMKSGVIFCEDILAETCYVKLGWVLGHPAWKNKVKEKMLENFAGEINKRLEE